MTSFEEFCKESWQSRIPFWYELNGPEKITVSKKEGGYSTAPFIGEEEFSPFDAYIGKKGTQIIKFRVKELDRFEWAEMTMAEACRRFDSFEADHLALVKKYEMSLRTEARATGDAIEDAADRAARNTNPLFGSW